MSCRVVCRTFMCFQPCEQIKKKRLLFMGIFEIPSIAIITTFIWAKTFPSKFQHWKLLQVKIVTLSGQKCVASRLAKLTGHYCVWGSSARRCFSSAICHVIMLFLATNSSPTLVGEMCMCSEQRVFNRTRPTSTHVAPSSLRSLVACEAGLRSNCESPRRLERPPHWEGEGSAGRMTFTTTSSDLDPLCDWLIGIPCY